MNPSGSAWDRACELYAQLTGTVVDYGKEHSERCKHDRFGKDFSKKPLIKDFDQSKLALFGHSFGGDTDRIFSIVTLSAPTNGTTASGLEIDQTWQSNDGLVNEISSIQPGIWHEMPTTHGDHMYFQGGMTKRVKIKSFYLEMVKMISGI